MKLLRRIRCWLGRHQFDRRRVVRYGDEHYSVCIGCGREMVRDPRRDVPVFIALSPPKRRR
jgi:hypothetical protein